MLINVSNHTSANWPEEQKQAAIRLFGVIKDIAFPHIDPVADNDAILALANDFGNRIVKCFNNPPAPFIKGEVHAVHIMGEMTFTCAVVALLQYRNIVCVASTTERIVDEAVDGSKNVVFQFVQFREYTRSL